MGRYLGRSVIATSRIDNYDGENVTFHYNRHEDDAYVEKTIPAMELIDRLIRHIPEKHFKMIRYGGLSARHRKSDKSGTVPFLGKSTNSCAVSMNGEPPFFPLSAMTH